MKEFKLQTRDAVLEIAKSQLGVMESPRGSNRQKYGKAYGLDGAAWCLIFVWWVFNEAGFKKFYKTASCTALKNQYKSADPAKKQGTWVTSGYMPGDLVMFDWSGNRKITEHVGIVESVKPNGNLMVIEGNTSVGNDSNGGEVMLRERNPRFVTGACRPAYNM